MERLRTTSAPSKHPHDHIGLDSMRGGGAGGPLHVFVVPHLLTRAPPPYRPHQDGGCSHAHIDAGAALLNILAGHRWGAHGGPRKGSTPPPPLKAKPR